MDHGFVLDIGRQGLQVALMVSMPILAVTRFLGLMVSVFQAITQVQEMTLTFVPKLIGVGLVLTFMGSWMLTTLARFMVICLERTATVGH